MYLGKYNKNCLVPASSGWSIPCTPSLISRGFLWSKPKISLENLWWSLRKVIPYCFVVRNGFLCISRQLLMHWCLILRNASCHYWECCHKAKHLLNSFFFAKYYSRIWPLERSLPAWSTPEFCFSVIEFISWVWSQQ